MEEVMQVDDQERDGVMEHRQPTHRIRWRYLVLHPIVIYSLSSKFASYSTGLEYDCLSRTNKEMSARGVGGR